MMSATDPNAYWAMFPPENRSVGCNELCPFFAPCPMDGSFGICVDLSEITDGKCDIEWRGRMEIGATCCEI